MRRYFVRLTTEEWDRLRDLHSVRGFDVFFRTARQRSPGRFEIEGLLSEPQIEQVRALGYGVELMRDAGEVGRQRQSEVGGQDDSDREGNES